ncbi:MAG: GGDEF domain-containing protein [Treponema sp.]|nr:GGDEF domain-containing protein [Treponema sp.]
MEIKKDNKKSSDSSSNGKVISGSIIAAVCIVIYLFALVQATVRIYISVDQRKTAAKQEFTWIKDIALSFGKMGFLDDRFIKIMDDSLKSTKTIEALIVTGADKEHAFEKKTGNAITWVNNSPRFKNKLNLSNQDLFDALDISGIRNVYIKGIASAFDYEDFSKILKETLLIIFAGLILAFFTLLLYFLAEKPKGRMIRVPSPKRRSERTPVSGEPVIYAGDGGPKGLYSPRSSIGWEEYTEDRLDSELHRSSSTENDLVLISMEFPGLLDDDMFKQAADEAVNFFTSRDLLFESGKHGISVILPGIGLEAAIEKSENFYQRIMEKFSDQETYIGISSRSGRLLNAGRLMLEAAEALKRAKSTKTSIMAFKSDPEKYREFVRTH